MTPDYSYRLTRKDDRATGFGGVGLMESLLVFLFTGVRADERTRVFNKIGARRRRNG